MDAILLFLIHQDRLICPVIHARRLLFGLTVQVVLCASSGPLKVLLLLRKFRSFQVMTEAELSFFEPFLKVPFRLKS